jgi:hypothetical protein
MQRSKKVPIAFVLAGAIAAFGTLLYFAPSAYEVVDKGPYVRPYSPEPESVYELRLFDSVTVYADAESQPSTDNISGATLVALSTAALITCLLLGASGAPRKLRRFYGLAALGAAYLAIDEFVAIHETVGHNLPFLADLPGVEHPDDILVSLYLIPALAFVVWSRDILLGSRRSRTFFGLGILFFLAAAVGDLAALPIDELCEVLAGAALAVGFISLIVEHLTVHLELAPRDGGLAGPTA